MMSELEPLEEAEEPLAGFGHLSVSGDRASAGPHGRAITQEMLIRAVDRQNPTRAPTAGTDAVKVLAKQTHMHLNGQRISIISNLHLVKNLAVLYLYDNLIINMRDGFAGLSNLTHLYLQNNQISRIEGISGLPNLSKLYLQGNQIAHVDNLQGLPSLEELHLSNQKLQPGEGMTFDLHSMHAVSGTLRVLVASGCSIRDESVAMLPPLPQLRKLDLADNYLEVVESLEVVMRSAGRLMVVELHGNPFCRGQAQRYREAVILMSDSMASLDGQEVSPQQRAFLLRFQLQKLKNQVAAEQAPDEHAGASERTGHAGHQASANARRPVSQQPSMARGGSFRNKAAESSARLGGPLLDGMDLPVLSGTRIK